MDIRQLLTKEHIIFNPAGRDREAILRQLAAPLVRDGVVADEAAFLKELAAREDQVTTQVPGGVAFPHARSHTVRRLALTVGLAPAPGLAFSGGDREPCRLLFLIAVPSSAPTAHLPLLKHLSSAVRHETRVARLLEAHTAAQVIRILATHKA